MFYLLLTEFEQKGKENGNLKGFPKSMYPFEEKHVSCFGKGYMLFLQWMRALNDINLDNISGCVDIIINIIIFVA